MCLYCCKNPSNHPCSIINGYDCRRISSLPSLSKIAKNSMPSARLFAQNYHLNNRTSIRHSISFKLTRPSICTNNTSPEISSDNMSQVTFASAREE